MGYWISQHDDHAVRSYSLFSMQFLRQNLPVANALTMQHINPHAYSGFFFFPLSQLKFSSFPLTTSYTLKSLNLRWIGHFLLMKTLKIHQSMRWNASNYMSKDLLILLSMSERGVFGWLFSWRVENLFPLFWVPLLLCNCTDLAQIEFKRILVLYITYFVVLR